MYCERLLQRSGGEKLRKRYKSGNEKNEERREEKEEIFSDKNFNSRATVIMNMSLPHIPRT